MTLVVVCVTASGIQSCLAQTEGTIDFSGYSSLGSYRSDGLYNLVGLGTWNGAPLSSSNMPTDAERELAASINFFANPSAPNVLFVQVTDVVATRFGFANGTAFYNITQTGVQFSLPSSINLGAPSISLNYANPGETLAYAPPDNSSSPLTTTPGFGITEPNQNQFLIQTTGGANYGFIDNGWIVYGGTLYRIEGGGVFELTFDPSVNLFQDVDFLAAGVQSQYGTGNQYIDATIIVPEPSILPVSGLLVGFILLFRKSR